MNSISDDTVIAEASLPNPSESPPIDAATTELREEEEGDEEEEEEDEEGGSRGDVPSDIMATKPGESSGRNAAKVGLDKNQQKPPYSYAQLIVQALLASKDHRQTLSSIYNFISDMYPYYKMEDKGWKVGVAFRVIVVCV